jgi:hypothetical protein
MSNTQMTAEISTVHTASKIVRVVIRDTSVHQTVAAWLKAAGFFVTADSLSWGISDPTQYTVLLAVTRAGE